MFLIIENLNYVIVDKQEAFATLSIPATFETITIRKNKLTIQKRTHTQNRTKKKTNAFRLVETILSESRIVHKIMHVHTHKIAPERI